jgi:hypothetical protein
MASTGVGFSGSGGAAAKRSSKIYHQERIKKDSFDWNPL